jgi:16S rRNA pseudouridine516 synthase
MRLDNYVSLALNVTRQDAYHLIKDELITVNGQIINKKDYKIDDNKDIIGYDNKILTYEKNVYYMLNKPYGYVCDRKNELYKSVFSLLEDRTTLSVAGRLDYDTTGLVLVSSDGTFIHNIIHHNSIYKTYKCQGENNISDSDITKLSNGVSIYLDKEKIYYKTNKAIIKRESNDTILLTINEGKFHQVKKMFESIGNKIKTLERISIGSITLDSNLNYGDFRKLTNIEIDSILKAKN